MLEGLFQPMHLLIIFGIALLVFGPKKLPELGKGIGEGIRGFKSAMKADEGLWHGNPIRAYARASGTGTEAAAHNTGPRGAG
jgi:TatA/E family protein of Tat protein translocase